MGSAEIYESLCYRKKHGSDVIDAKDKAAVREYCAGYKEFLDKGRTERECVSEIVALAENSGFVKYERGKELHAGDRIYRINRGKTVMLAVIGSSPMASGINISAAHIDSPRVDLKQMPLYETDDMAYLRTHYYGGIRKYQWVAMPLALHGVVVCADGTVREICIGEEPDDPVITITDLLPHLAADQNTKPLGDAFRGEDLKILVGSSPIEGYDGEDRVRIAILDILHSKYDMIEEDFLSAELMVVPAIKAKDVGLDRSMIGAYGQDDRVCAYAALKAIMEMESPKRTCVCILVDKEEVGSEGVTGMKSDAFGTFMEDLCASDGSLPCECYENSFCLSADVTAAYDPGYADVFEKQNSALINCGVAICKFTGSKGKHAASDASAELMGRSGGSCTMRTLYGSRPSLARSTRAAAVPLPNISPKGI